MSTSLPLFDRIFDGPPLTKEPPPVNDCEEGLARTEDPATSRLAAMGIDATAMEAVVIAALRRHGPMTTEQIADVTRLSLVTVSPRMKPLVNKSQVEDSKMKARNRSGRNAIVWKLVRDL